MYIYYKRQPSEEWPFEVDISDDQSIYIRSGLRQERRGNISDCEFHTLEQLCRNIKIRFPHHGSMCLDGTMHSLKISEGFTLLAVEWQNEAPGEWQGVEELIDNIIKSARLS